MRRNKAQTARWVVCTEVLAPKARRNEANLRAHISTMRRRVRILGGLFCRYRSLGVTASTADAFFHWKHLAGDELFARGKQFVSPADPGGAPKVKEHCECKAF